MTSTTQKQKSGFITGRHLARLSAIQALYQMDIANKKSKYVVQEFNEHWFVLDAGEGKDYPDKTFFELVVLGVVAEQDAIDVAISSKLNEKWKLSRLDATLRAILRCASFEMLNMKDIPAIVVIDEYVGLAREFFDDRETKFINAALDKMAREHRADELCVDKKTDG
jgi:N utilization substance protein B